MNKAQIEVNHILDESDLYLSEQRSCSSQSSEESKKKDSIIIRDHFDPVSMKDIKRLSEQTSQSKKRQTKVIGAGFKLKYNSKKRKVMSNAISPGTLMC